MAFDSARSSKTPLMQSVLGTGRAATAERRWCLIFQSILFFSFGNNYYSIQLLPIAVKKLRDFETL